MHIKIRVHIVQECVTNSFPSHRCAGAGRRVSDASAPRSLDIVDKSLRFPGDRECSGVPRAVAEPGDEEPTPRECSPVTHKMDGVCPAGYSYSRSKK